MLRLFANPRDRIALRWLLGLGSNDFRCGAYSRLRTYCEENGGEPRDILAQLRDAQIRIPNTKHLLTRFGEIEAELERLRLLDDIEAIVPGWLQNAINVDDPFHDLVLDLALMLAWRISITMEAAFCVETLEDALAHHGKPDIFNTDQGSQFTGLAFTGVLADNGITISMDGKGAWRDNVFVERLWRSVKYEEVYLRAYDSVSEARASIGRYLDF